MYLFTVPNMTCGGCAKSVTKALQIVDAAAKIHTDIQRGFIRAEIVGFADLERTRSFPEARKQGVLRSEGKTYVMQDGDVVNFLFNV